MQLNKLLYQGLARIVPKSINFFSGNAIHEDNILLLEKLYNRYYKFPKAVQSDKTGKNPGIQGNGWLNIRDYKKLVNNDNLKITQYNQLIFLLNQLNQIDPQLTNHQIRSTLAQFAKRTADTNAQRKMPELDSFGRSVATAGRKSCTAKVYLVRGTGEILVNNRSLNDYFPYLKDRESIMYPMQTVDAVDKYNVYALASGGGPTGQAEAIMLGIGKALLAFNPLLKPRLHKAGVLTRDTRRVERKKPGKLKARKSPTWVKR